MRKVTTGSIGFRMRWPGLALLAFAGILSCFLLRTPAGQAAPAQSENPPCQWMEPANKVLQTPIIPERVFNGILMCVEVNGEPGKIILDSGNSTTFVSPKKSRIPLRNPERTITTLRGSGWVSTGQWGEVNIHLGGTYWVNRRVVIDDISPISKSLGQRVDGILGEDLLRRYRSVLIDYEKNTLTLVEP